jgi:PAS domain S-box-containing protein
MDDSADFTGESIAAAILAGSPDAVVASDRQGLIRFWSAGAERVFGYSAPEALGQSLDVIIPERLRARHWEGYHQVMAEGRSRYSAGELLSVPALRKDGSTVSVEFTITPLRSGHGGIAGLVAVMRDVTARFAETKALRAQIRELSQRSG